MKAIQAIGEWDALSEKDRLDGAGAVSYGLGPEFAPVATLFGARRLAAVLHTSTNVTFMIVPGGTLQMGVSNPERDAILKLARASSHGDQAVVSEIAEQLECSRPAHEVSVRPFLLSRSPLLKGLADTVIDAWDRAADRALLDVVAADPATKPAQVTRKEAARAIRRLGFRLCCEAEWEWVAREGGTVSWVCENPSSPNWEPSDAVAALCSKEAFDSADADPLVVNGFGLWGLLWGEWVADSVHRNYAGAPREAVAWNPKDEPHLLRAFGAATFWPWQDPREFIACHAAFRTWTRDQNQAASVRMAFDLAAVGRPQ